MKVNTIKNFIMGTLLAGGAALMSGCSGYSTDKGLHDYMESKGATKAQLDSIFEATEEANGPSTAIRRQSTLDSMAFRNVFNYTHLANDSAACAEFNKIASKGLISGICAYALPSPGKMSKQHLIETLTNEGKTISFMDSINNDFMSQSIYSTDEDIQYYQHYIDKNLYRDFFERHNLLNENDNGRNIRHAFFTTWHNTTPKNIKNSNYQNDGLGQ